MNRLMCLILVASPVVFAVIVKADEVFVGQANSRASIQTAAPTVATPTSLSAVSQIAVKQNTSQITQAGRNNNATLTQYGGANLSVLSQQGQGNTAVVTQSNRTH